MSIFKRNLAVLPVLGMLALAACGGGDDSADTAATGDSVAPAAPAPAPAAPAAAGTVHEVRMVTSPDGASGTFEPANITVAKGDRIRFITDGLNGVAHNVEFPAAENAGATGLPAPSPYLNTPGQTYEMEVTMDAGTYTYVCLPHQTMGMRGTIVVQ